jgi:hypothetical protein
MTTNKETEDNRAEDQARAQLESIINMVVRLRDAEEDDNEETREDVIEEIQEDPLSVEVRGGWKTLGSEDEEGPAEYMILLCTGGPAVRIVGDLGQYNEPESARIEYQDWFTPWASLPMRREEREYVIEYARQFYFGS